MVGGKREGGRQPTLIVTVPRIKLHFCTNGLPELSKLKAETRSTLLQRNLKPLLKQEASHKWKCHDVCELC